MLGSICLSTEGDATVNQSKYPIGGNFEKRLKISEVPFMNLLTGSCRSTGPAASAFRIGAWACVLGRIRLFVTSWTVACQAPLSMGFRRQDYSSRLLFPLPKDLPDPGTEPTSPALAGGFFTTEPPGKPFSNL